MFDLGKKITVITGAGSGIGKAIAERFASQHATVFLLENRSVNGINLYVDSGWLLM